MNSFRISLVQMNSITSNKDLNLQKIRSFVDEAAKKEVKMICFPELSTCGYDRNPSISLWENINGYTSETLVKMSKSKNMVIIAGMFEKHLHNIYITQVITFPDGKIEKYRKTHLGRHERKIFSAGQNLPIFEIEKVKFGIGICYDMHFPEVVASLSLQGAHIVFAPHASPMSGKKRLEIWKKYMGARAYDNRVYLCACNLIGNNGSKKFGGGIGIWDPSGNIVKEYTEEKEKIIFFDVNLDILNDIRNGKMRHMKNQFFLRDRRKDLYL
ncbi:nitrilase-related carbon-nitrogen hydrolase [Paramaledivibacter caminithermalis]|jgi:predicted amidohydrolase|uniref:Predicted amidohydrolase n=1 Tax=Paramaledivibacter caminithermalis (strain DSM 15212 / CIP 107654 / DViRD3) TaxID=1121301 RepID=A0A1M6RB67_PARC5|nr:nitrilase-related carbon-nitrogen hydrolase [Paramaledivibacter caminithermalis]SHK29676.1 Predicted amidohydrolase [Paramaledivibacter caminithermalis DSM 15212]